MENSLEYQVGGNHYQGYQKQPVQLIVECGWSFCQGNVAKYVLRHKYKNGIEDLKKAIHYCYFGRDLNDNEVDETHKKQIAEFKEVNNIDDDTLIYVLKEIDEKNWPTASALINLLIDKYYSQQSKS